MSGILLYVAKTYVLLCIDIREARRRGGQSSLLLECLAGLQKPIPDGLVLGIC